MQEEFDTSMWYDYWYCGMIGTRNGKIKCFQRTSTCISNSIPQAFALQCHFPPPFAPPPPIAHLFRHSFILSSRVHKAEAGLPCLCKSHSQGTIIVAVELQTSLLQCRLAEGHGLQASTVWWSLAASNISSLLHSEVAPHLAFPVTPLGWNETLKLCSVLGSDFFNIILFRV